MLTAQAARPPKLRNLRFKNFQEHLQCEALVAESIRESRQLRERQVEVILPLCAFWGGAPRYIAACGLRLGCGVRLLGPWTLGFGSACLRAQACRMLAAADLVDLA